MTDDRETHLRPPFMLFCGHMAGLLAFSALIVPLLIARWAAGARNARRGMRRTLILTLAFNFAYMVALVFVYFRLL